MVWIFVGAGVVFVIIFIAAIFATHEEMGIDKKYGTCTATFDLNAFDINQNVRIYDDSQVVWLKGIAYNYSDLRSVDLNVDTKEGKSKTVATTSTSTLGTIGRSMAGKLVGGNTGALIGAGTAKKRTVIEQVSEGDVTQYIVGVYVDDIKRPYVSFNFKEKRDKAYQLYSTLQLIIERNQ